MTKESDWDNQAMSESFTVADIQSNHPWEMTLVTPVNQLNDRIKREAMNAIRQECTEHSMQSKRIIDDALKILTY